MGSVRHGMHCFILERQMGLSKRGKNGSSEACNVTPAREHWLHSLVVETIHHTETNRAALRRCCVNMTAPQGKAAHFYRAEGGQRDELDRQTVYLDYIYWKRPGTSVKCSKRIYLSSFTHCHVVPNPQDTCLSFHVYHMWCDICMCVDNCLDVNKI